MKFACPCLHYFHVWCAGRPSSERHRGPSQTPWNRKALAALGLPGEQPLQRPGSAVWRPSPVTRVPGRPLAHSATGDRPPPRAAVVDRRPAACSSESRGQGRGWEQRSLAYQARLHWPLRGIGAVLIPQFRTYSIAIYFESSVSFGQEFRTCIAIRCHAVLAGSNAVHSSCAERLECT